MCQYGHDSFWFRANLAAIAFCDSMFYDFGLGSPNLQLEIMMLACRPSKLVTSIFRLQMHFLNGPLLAIFFPLLNTRNLPFECVVYFVQHIMLLLIPTVILDQNTVYSVEPMDDLSWAVLSLSLQTLYHFWVLQPLALFTEINLNNMLCPAVTDPFSGPHYRMVAMIHQTALILILGKCVACFSLTWSGRPLPWSTISVDFPSPPKTVGSKRISDSGLLDTWLESNMELEDMSLATSSWCWSDLFRYQTYFCDRMSKTVYGATAAQSSLVGLTTPRAVTPHEKGVEKSVKCD